MLKAALVDILSIGPKVNATSRKEIIDVVGNLTDELDRALAYGESYLTGVRYSIDDAEMVRYLSDAENKLMRSFMEHHVCAGLYHLADRFTQLFDPVKLGVSLENHGEIVALINMLQNGERSVLDELESLVNDMRDYAEKLHNAAPHEVDKVKTSIATCVEYYKGKIASKRKMLKHIRRTLTDKL